MSDISQAFGGELIDTQTLFEKQLEIDFCLITSQGIQMERKLMKLKVEEGKKIQGSKQRQTQQVQSVVTVTLTDDNFFIVGVNLDQQSYMLIKKDQKLNIDFQQLPQKLQILFESSTHNDRVAYIL
eukprot:CAMPEP_0170555744 /NCGR_PEP_ID=MMETSP0211-20121228/13581_1 /TAXON_ID=311385 /ORGANISM="Pseudokeronopsis sp., Strain OXSARD2" /LENGTH=125 /DNA_ID=CAMNT_0010865727 /DNA_START=239 /DNA_END=616 /DNA_ORIENTATION=-